MRCQISHYSSHHYMYTVIQLVRIFSICQSTPEHEARFGPRSADDMSAAGQEEKANEVPSFICPGHFLNVCLVRGNSDLTTTNQP